MLDTILKGHWNLPSDRFISRARLWPDSKEEGKKLLIDNMTKINDRATYAASGA
jgi:hypothetical protein